MRSGGVAPDPPRSPALLRPCALRHGGTRGDSVPGSALRRAPCRRRPAVGDRRRSGLGRAPARQRSGERHGRLLRRRRHAPGPRREVRGAGPDADDRRAAQERHVSQRQRAPDRGAAEHGRGLVQPRYRCVARRPRVDQQHVPHQRRHVRQQHVVVRERGPQGGEPGPGGRARRPQGRPSRMGRRRQRDDPGPDDRLPVVLLRPRRRDELRVGVGHRRQRSGVRPAVRPSGGLRRPAPVRGRRPDGGDRLDRVAARDLQPRDGDAPPGARLRHRQVRPQRLDLRQHQ